MLNQARQYRDAGTIPLASGCAAGSSVGRLLTHAVLYRSCVARNRCVKITTSTSKSSITFLTFYSAAQPIDGKSETDGAASKPKRGASNRAVAKKALTNMAKKE